MAGIPVCDLNSLPKAKAFLLKENLLLDYDDPKSDLLVIPFNCEPLDSVTGVGGLPRGRIVELSGHESSGKSTIALELCREELFGNPNSICAYLDFEYSLSRSYLEGLGLTHPTVKDRFLPFNITTVEEAEHVVASLIKSGQNPSLVVVDSVAAMVPDSTTERDFDKSAEVGAHARKVTQLLTRWVPLGRKYGTCFFLLNQLRTKIKTDKFDHSNKAIPGMPGSENDVTPGGRALPFFASMRLRLDVKTAYAIKVLNPKTNEEEKIPIANWVKMTCFKNKVAPPYKAATFYLEYGKGVNMVRTLIEHAQKQKLISTSGSYLKFSNGDKEYKAQGLEKLVDLLTKDQEANAALRDLIGWDKPMDMASGEIGEVEIGAITLDDDVNLLQEVESELTIIGRAIKLGLVEKQGSQYVYTHQGVETRGKTEEVLTRRLSSEAVAALEKSVDSALKNLRGNGKATP